LKYQNFQILCRFFQILLYLDYKNISMKNRNKSIPDFLFEAQEENNAQIMPILPDEGDYELPSIPEELPILPVRNMVLFPNVVLPITVGRAKSLKLIKKISKGNKLIGVIAQRHEVTQEPTQKDLYEIGTVAEIVKMIALPDGNVTIIVQGKQRFQIEKYTHETPFLKAKIKLQEDIFPKKTDKHFKVLMASLKETALRIIQMNPDISPEARITIENIENSSFFVHFLCSNINAELSEKQILLEKTSATERATSLLSLMLKDMQMLELKAEIHHKASSEMDSQQKDYFLRQQLKVLQDELGNEAGGVRIDELKAKAKEKKWTEQAQKQFDKELIRLQRANVTSPEYPISLNYIELMLDLPWEEYTKDNLDIKNAKAILDADHFGLEKVKERLLEYLSVLKLRNNLRGPILCLYGPPGVGKTSLGKSIAKALGRKYVRMSLGGLHDEAEIRGHRKTYIGAMPGKMITNIKKAGVSNPVFILDELDKIGADHRGDPASALLEVLDPEQNNTFTDNYLEVEYDLSKVLFVATANSLDTIHPALRDRMEIIEITGYTMEEKVEIAKRHLVPKQLEEHGILPKQIIFDDKAIAKIIEDYTRESGVRSLERKIGAVIRKIAKAIAMEEKYDKKILPKHIIQFLGAEIFDKEMYENDDVAGVVTGLAWTQVGGEILFVESSLSRGKGKMTLSGQLGDVMKESAMTALSYLKSEVLKLGISHKVFNQFDLHIHIPAGAVPKDGPSAGITMLTSLASVYTQRKVKDKLAMTGEITLRGRVLPVGGIQEKILAAKRAGILEIILSEKNKKDIEEINQQYIKNIKFHYVKHVDEVLQIALLPQKVKNAMDLSILDEKA
jgi:ATP-dependent Lon protease